LQCEPGKRPVRREHRGKDHNLEACSESSLLRAIDPPERSRNGERLGINTSLEMQEVQRPLQGAAQARWRWDNTDDFLRSFFKPIENEQARAEAIRQHENDQYLRNQQYFENQHAIRQAQERQERQALEERWREHDEMQAAMERKREEEKRALETPLGRILDARKRGAAPSVNDRIQHAIDNRKWTSAEIQRWDHSQGFGMILRLKQINEYLKRGRK
jgi:hypothetical protein